MSFPDVWRKGKLMRWSRGDEFGFWYVAKRSFRENWTYQSRAQERETPWQVSLLNVFNWWLILREEMRFSHILHNEYNVNAPSPPPLLSPAPQTHALAMDSPKNKRKSSSSLSSFLPRKFSRSELSYSQEVSEFCVCVCVCVCVRVCTRVLTQASMQTWACASTVFQHDETVAVVFLGSSRVCSKPGQ